jgi:hypothetical protein
MIDAEVLKKAVEKAVGNGWDKGKNVLCFHIENFVEMIVFDHSFAKAFWGEGETVFSREPLKEHFQSRRYGSFGRVVHLPDWQYHLQQMVLYENPIDYLRKFVKEEHAKEKI